MKTQVQIIFVKQIAGISKKTQQPYDMRMAQCIAQVPSKEGEIEPLIGELVLPAALKDTMPGHYLVDFRLIVSNEKRIESVVESLTPCDAKGNPLPVPPAAKAPEAKAA
jgi:hypothetical protein